ncbi:TonB-dependent receptor [Telluribacter sp. SYSU D00476]|uniref:TonB-dependent receptor n=1 Tax=Telluribacter sp. SYSU D00476 TaxID=2811430 RepID=UPI001FF330E5|nr:TonB-dependent receptor [Telluribacter sp. SYSU D00476]
MKNASLLFLFLLAFPGYAQKTISGYVLDAATEEAIAGAVVYNPGQKAGVVTNRSGFFSIQVPRVPATIICSYLGYATDTLRITSARDTSVVVRLAQVAKELKEVAVRGQIPLAERELGLVSLPIQQLKVVPTLLGEADVLKAIALTPGISSTVEGTAGVTVRGGTPDQNLILLDDAVVYNVSHLFGFVSLFHPDALQKVDVYKGGFPARYGGRLSSVIDLTMREGNYRERQSQLSVGLIGSQFLWEGPLSRKNTDSEQPSRTSFMVAARSSYLSLILLPVYAAYKWGSLRNYSNYWFYDLNGKINHRFRNGGQLSWSIYNGYDFWNSQEKASAVSQRSRLGLDWGNTTSTLLYKKALGAKWFSTSSLTYTRYHYQVSFDSYAEGGRQPSTYYRNNSGLQDWSLRTRWEYYASPGLTVRTGVEAIGHLYRTARIKTNYLAQETPVAGTPVTGTPLTPETALYLEAEVRPRSWLKVNAGARWATFFPARATYTFLEPRASLLLILPEDYAFKLGYTRMNQFTHLLTSNGLAGAVNDVWVPSTATLPPQNAHQWSGGVTKDISALNLELTVEGYYKRLHNLIDYQTGQSLMNVTDGNWERVVTRNGIGEVYGYELFAHRRAGKWSGWLGYTLSWNRRRFESINRGNWYPGPYDRRHYINLVVNHEATRGGGFSASWQYHSGQPITMPAAVIPNLEYPNSVPNEVIGDRNNARMPAFHRLDVSYRLAHPTRRAREKTVTLGVINLYAQKNPFILTYTQGLIQEPHSGDPRVPQPIVGINNRVLQISPIRFLPFVSLSWKY